jgi:hypothetical protein
MPIPTLVVGLLVGEDQATSGNEHASDALDEGRFDAFDLVGVVVDHPVAVDGDGTTWPYPAGARVDATGSAPLPEELGVALRRIHDRLDEQKLVVAGWGVSTTDDDWRNELLRDVVAQVESAAADGIPAPTGHDKTSLVVFQRADRPGSLLGILQEFAARSLNLTRLESRPTKQGLGDYCFLMDLEGHLVDELVADCLRNLHMKHGSVKFLGSYPAAGSNGDVVRHEASEASQSADGWLDDLRTRIRD